MTTIDTPRTASPLATSLRSLYLARFGFAAVWALLLTLTASRPGLLTAGLLLLYPAADLVAAVVDRRVSRATGSTRALVVTMLLSLLTVVGLAFAVGSGVRAVLVVWGAWAVTAGAVQLVVALGRRALGGQWPMVLSGGLSVLAGAAFVAQSGSPSASLTSLAGYATLGGVFFLVSALRLGRSAKGRATLTR